MSRLSFHRKPDFLSNLSAVTFLLILAAVLYFSPQRQALEALNFDLLTVISADEKPDQALVINAEEEIFEMANGCICCTVRGDLIRVLGNLMKRRDKFDYVIVETTGLADPGPVAQTFFMDDEISSEFSLDGIITLVDTFHIHQQLGRSNESTEQIAFADVIVLNKTDLINNNELDKLESRLRE